MGRRLIKLETEIFLSTIKELDGDPAFNNRDSLMEAITKIYNLKTSLNVSKQYIYNKINELKIELKTPKGRRGFAHKTAPQTPQPSSEPTAGRYPKFAQQPYTDSFKAMRQAAAGFRGLTIERKMLKLVKRIEKGSVTAAVKLKCIDCCGGYIKEIKECSMKDCALWPFRPFQSSLLETETPLIEITPIEVIKIDEGQIKAKPPNIVPKLLESPRIVKT